MIFFQFKVNEPLKLSVVQRQQKFAKKLKSQINKHKENFSRNK